MEIWRRTLDPDEELGRLSERNDSLLADKISMLHAFFSLLKQDISEEDKNLLDAAFVECYAQFGITHDNASIFDADAIGKPCPHSATYIICSKVDRKSRISPYF